MVAEKKYPDEPRARAVRLYREFNPKPVIRQLAAQLGVQHETLGPAGVLRPGQGTPQAAAKQLGRGAVGGSQAAVPRHGRGEPAR